MTDTLSIAGEGLQRSTITRALREIKALKHELQRRPPARSEVVVASAACRLPQAATPEEFWDLLCTGGSTAGPVPEDRWDNSAVFAAFPGRTGTSYADRASFLESPFSFDPEPFGMSPREAASTDPHHRLVMMCAWEALERAGVAPTSLRGSRTGVFVGMSGNDFERSRLAAGSIKDIDGLASMGSSVNFAANRLSYALGLQGPSLVVDTACSSSLVALHQARRALEEGDCDLAIVAGVNVMLSAEAMVALSQSRMLSPTGRCHTFSDRADGYARGEGCVVVVLRRAHDQPAGAAAPLGTLLSTAVNQDGPTSGITVPNGRAQADLIRRAIKAAGVETQDVDYVEAHGTGTALGDPIELRALASVHAGRRRDRQLLVGATKPMTGHLEGAAGLVGLLKCLLVVQEGTVPAQPLDGGLTQGIDWESLPLSVPTSAVELESDRPVAGVSSFGYGGTNAHALVRRSRAVRLDREGAPVSVPPVETYPWRLTELNPLATRPRRAAGAGAGLNLRIFRTGEGSAEAHAEIDERSVPLLREHMVHGRMVVPGVVFMELVLRLAEAVVGRSARVVSLDIARPCVVGDGEARALALTWDVTDGRHTVTVASGPASESGATNPQHHVTATVVADGVCPPAADAARFGPAGGEPVRTLDHAEFYAAMWPAAFHIGPSLKLVETARQDPAGRLEADLSPAPDGCAALASGIRSELLVLDAAIQVAGALRTDRSDGVVTLGTGFSDLSLADGAEFAGGARVRAVAGAEGRADLMICSPAGEPLAVISGVTNLPVSTEQLAGVADRTRRPVVGELDLGDGTEALVKRAIGAVLDIDASAVESRSRVEDLMDSILLVELGELLTPHAPDPVGVPDLLDAETVEGLAALLDDGAVTTVVPVPGETVTRGEPDAGDTTSAAGGPPLRRRELTVEAMTALAAAADLPDVDVVPRADLPRGILLTGGTGFVGSFLLHELLTTTDRHVFCLVRAESQDEAARRLRSAAAAHGLPADLFDDRVTAVVGDLTQDRFGMDTSAYDGLHAQVGEIFHNAGAVKWTSSYDQLAPHNVGGTAEIIRFATLGPARVVHFTSTVGVFSSDRVDLGAVDESVPLTDSNALMVGYAQTKWVSEMMIRRAGERGLRYTIHRINSGPSSTAGGFNRLDHLSLIIKGCVESGLAPLDGPFPVQAAPIDHVARAYVRLALDPSFEGGTSHLVNEPVVAWSEFFEHVGSYGYPLTRLPFEEWRTAVTGRRSGTLALLGLAPFLTRTVDDVRLADFGAPMTRSALGASGPWCPVVDRELVHTFLDGFVAGRFFPAPTSQS
jgi:thioester reductase-like protein